MSTVYTTSALQHLSNLQLQACSARLVTIWIAARRIRTSAAMR